MNKIAIITDSNSGFDDKLAQEYDVHIVHMPFNINGKEYLDGVNLSQEEFYGFLQEDTKIFTSMPSIGSVMDLWDELLKTHDEIIYIPMSSGLSSSCTVAMTSAMDDDYEGKVFVVDNQRISVTQKQSVFDACELRSAGKSASEIKRILEEQKFESSIYIMVDTLKYLKAGGRITPAAAAIGTLLNLKPVLQIQGEKLDAYSKCRGTKQAKKIMLQAMKNDQEKRFTGCFEQGRMHFAIAHTQNEDAALEFKEDILKEFPNTEITIDPLSLSVSCHIGPGALAIACSKAIEY